MVGPVSKSLPHAQTEAESSSVLRLQNVSKTYGEFTAVDDISFSIPKGSIYMVFLDLMVLARPPRFA